MDDILHNNYLLKHFNTIKVELNRTQVVLLFRDSHLSRFPTPSLKAIFVFTSPGIDSTNTKTTLGKGQLKRELSINENYNYISIFFFTKYTRFQNPSRNFKHLKSTTSLPLVQLIFLPLTLPHIH